MNFLLKVLSAALHVDDVRESIRRWRFTVSLFIGIGVASTLWCLSHDSRVGAALFLVVVSVAVVGGLRWDARGRARRDREAASRNEESRNCKSFH